MRNKNLLRRNEISTKLYENDYSDTDTLSGNIASVTSITRESQKSNKKYNYRIFDCSNNCLYDDINYNKQ